MKKYISLGVQPTNYKQYIYIHIWVNYKDLTVPPSPGIMVSKGNHLQIAAKISGE